MKPKETQRTRSVKDLTSALKEHLRELGYKSSSLKTYGCIFSRFEKYCDSRAIDEFSVQLSRDFVWECYGAVLGEHDRGKNINRAMHMLADFQRHGMIFKQHNVRLEGFSDEYEPLFESFLSDLGKSGIAESSIRKYRNFLFRLEAYLKNRGVVHFNQTETYHVNAYIESLAGLSQNTTSSTIWNLRRLFKFAHDNGYHNSDLSGVLPVVRYSHTKRLPATFTADEVERIVENIDRANPIGKRNYAIILLAAKLGLRVSDVIALSFASINWQAKQISITQRKTGIPLDLPLPEDVGWAIIDYLKYGRPETSCEKIFVRHNAPYDAMTANFAKDISRAVQKAGIKTPADKVIGMHTFRHSIATSMLNKGATIQEISQILGHASPESTEDYISLDTEMLRQCALEVTF
jgi:site-specific recombinase XerD